MQVRLHGDGRVAELTAAHRVDVAVDTEDGVTALELHRDEAGELRFRLILSTATLEWSFVVASGPLATWLPHLIAAARHEVTTEAFDHIVAMPDKPETKDHFEATWRFGRSFRER
jgi:hypothetical protein